MEKLTNAFWFLDTWKFEKYAACVFELLNVWSYYTKTVDTGAEHVVRVIHHRANFFFQYIGYLVVGHAVLHLFHVAENLAEASVTNLLVFAYKCRYEILFIAVQ